MKKNSLLITVFSVATLIVAAATIIVGVPAIRNAYYNKAEEARIDGDIEEALSAYEHAAKLGDKNALYALGQYYSSHEDPQHEDMAPYYLSQSIKKGKKEAAFDLAHYYLHEGDMDSAIQYLEMDAGDSTKTSLYLLGRILYEGQEAQKDTIKALDCLKKSAKLGSVDANVWMARYSYNILRDGPQAESYLIPAIDAGDAEAPMLLSKMRSWGQRGLTKDDEKAAKYAQLAAERGWVEAYNEIGYYYSSGTGVIKNDETAAFWFRKAHEAGVSEGTYNLALGYINGWGLHQDEKEGLRLLREAADKGNEDAIYALNRIHNYQVQQERNAQEQARRRQQAYERQRVTCPVCHGTGRASGIGTNGRMTTGICMTCSGTGTVSQKFADEYYGLVDQLNIYNHFFDYSTSERY